jgi:NitT/TauT family transport system permease protein
MAGTTPSRHDLELAGIDELDIPLHSEPGRLAKLWQATWPKLAATAILVGGWQVIVWLKLKPQYVLPGPVTVGKQLLTDLKSGVLFKATATTMTRAVIGYALAIVIGVIIGLVVSRSRRLRTAVGSLITGIQTMPSIAWFPLAILLFQLSERAILFVILLGAAPAIANGLIHGIDNIPPILLRAGRVLGARGFSRYRHIVIPAALPGFVGGLKQGWAFAWRSLMAGELLVIIATRPSLGARLEFARQNVDAPGLMAAMVVILIIGIAIDALAFARLERSIRARWGLAT